MITHKEAKRKYGWLAAKSRSPYYLAIIVATLALIGFAWLEYQRAATRNIWWAELQDTKRISIIAERECGEQVFEEVKKFYR